MLALVATQLVLASALELLLILGLTKKLAHIRLEQNWMLRRLLQSKTQVRLQALAASSVILCLNLAGLAPRLAVMGLLQFQRLVCKQ
jgi:hypothetical protein